MKILPIRITDVKPFLTNLFSHTASIASHAVSPFYQAGPATPAGTPQAVHVLACASLSAGRSTHSLEPDASHDAFGNSPCRAPVHGCGSFGNRSGLRLVLAYLSNNFICALIAFFADSRSSTSMEYKSDSNHSIRPCASSGSIMLLSTSDKGTGLIRVPIRISRSLVFGR
jgi:hypothetical protein